MIFRDAAALGLSGIGKAWIVSEAAAQAPNVPIGGPSFLLSQGGLTGQGWVQGA